MGRAPARGPLREYSRRRDFDSTPEPAPDPEPAREPSSGTARFVVHEHHARRLHWDLRLEHDGALASWAIPNGIPEDPHHNRKAVHVEDHPLDYIDFQGTIPRGQYGAGAVIVWDRGRYECEKWEPEKVVVVFHGERLRGRYALFQAGSEEKDWMIHRMDPPADPTAREIPDFISPMLARLTEQIPAREEEWAFEVKWDGVRAIARSEPGRIHLFSRNRNDITRAYPELRALNRALGSRAAILDGEILAFDEQGKPSFESLQSRIHVRGESAVRRLAESTPVTYMIFDLLWLEGHSLLDLPYSARRERLQSLQLQGPHWQVPASHPGEGTSLLAVTREQHLEGVIAKRLDSPYSPGARNGSWLKIKNIQRQEFVIGGWTAGKGARAGSLGALELGVNDPGGALRYSGRVGTGFDARELERLGALLRPLARKTSPFEGAPQPPRGAHFVTPRLVCEVEFGEWTREGLLRHSAYKGLRDDKPPESVIRELPEPAEDPRPSRARPAGRGAPAASSGAPPSSGPDIEALIAAGSKVHGGVEIELEGRTLKLTNLDKVLYPQSGFTKGDLIRFYAGVSQALVAQLHDHPLTLKRYPNGVAEKFFYEKHAPSHRPDWVATTPIPSGRAGKEVDYVLCQDLPTLVWLANLAAIELHPSLSRAGHPERPATLAFDLDPGAPAGFVECCEVALELSELFDQLGLRAFPKTSGSKGMQVYVPLNRPEVRYEQTKPFAHALANLLEQRRPDRVISRMTRSSRAGKVFIDWSQNDEHKTTVSVYSTRAKPRPCVSTPLTWEEVREAAERGDASLLALSPDEVLGRLRDRGDLFAEILTLEQALPELDL